MSDPSDFTNRIPIILAKGLIRATHDGRLDRVKRLLANTSHKYKVKVVNCEVDKMTTVLVACRYGHLNIVEYLVNECEADLSAKGSVVFDGEAIEGTTPLWAAAAAGYLPIVKFLLSKGADVNCTTSTNSTPLRAACFDGHFDVVMELIKNGADIEIANRHGHTSLMIACFKGHYCIAKYLLSMKADVNRKSKKGNTALHDSAESGNLDIFKMLIEHGGVMTVDSYGMTPLLAAAVTGHTHIVCYIIQELSTYSRTEVIDSYELLGATYVDKRRDIRLGYEFWAGAMRMRYSDPDKIIPKVVMTTNAAYNHVKEATSLEELQQMSLDPDAMRMQALIIRERILGRQHPDTSYFIRFRGAVYADSGEFDRCLSLWIYALEMQQEVLEPLNVLTQSSLFSFVELFSLMMAGGRPMNPFENPDSMVNRKYPDVKFEHVFEVFKKCAREITEGVKQSRDNLLYESYIEKAVIVFCHLCSIIGCLLPGASTEQCFDFHRLVYSILKLNIKLQNDRTILHLATARNNIPSYPAGRFPNKILTRILCKAGAKVDDVDKLGNTPLHLSAYCSTEIADVLIEYGAHVDTLNAERVSYSDIVKRLGGIPRNFVKQTTLCCLAAKAIRKHIIPYEDVVPKHLIPFIRKH